MSLSEQQRQFYEENGYLFPLQASTNPRPRNSAGNSTTTPSKTRIA